MITIGSVLSAVQRMYPGHSVFYKDGKKRHLQKPLRWLFFYARYDPGPPGKLSDWFQPREGSEDVEIEQVLVDNRDTIIEDHVTYSVNRDQVVSRIVDEMFHSVDLKENPYYRDKCQRKIDCKERRRRVAQLAVLRMAMYKFLLSVFGFFVWASIVNATPTAAMLNGLTTIPVIKHTFGQSVKLLYRLPSGENGSIIFVPGTRTVLQDGTTVLEPDTNSFVVAVTDRNDEPQIVPRSTDRWGRMAIVDTKPFKLRVILHRIFVERPQVTGIPAWPGGAACYRRSRYIL